MSRDQPVPRRVAPFVKVCCIADPAEAALAVAAGASALGLVSRMPSGPGVIDEAAIACIAAAVPPPVATFLLSAETRADALIAQQRRCRATTLQLVDAVPERELAAVREALPGVRLVPVVHVTGEASVDEALRWAESGLADALLLDSGNPSAPVKELGGTGRVHDWALSARIVADSALPVFLAGGLRPDNVGAAIRQVRPHGLDLCSGVRRDGRLHGPTLLAFMAAVRAAAATDGGGAAAQEALHG